MNERISELQQDVKKLDAKIENVDSRTQILQARYRRKENEIRFRERKQRAHRLIGIGAEVESVMGRQIAKEELPAFREYMKRAELVIGAFRVVDGRCSFLLP